MMDIITLSEECFCNLVDTIFRHERLIVKQAKEIAELKDLLEQALDDSRQLIEQINKRGEK